MSHCSVVPRSFSGPQDAILYHTSALAFAAVITFTMLIFSQYKNVLSRLSLHVLSEYFLLLSILPRLIAKVAIPTKVPCICFQILSHSAVSYYTVVLLSMTAFYIALRCINSQPSASYRSSLCFVLGVSGGLANVLGERGRAQGQLSH